MTLPFTIEQFLDVFARYNLAIQPLQFVAYALGLLAIAVAVKGGRDSGRIIFTILAIFWLWIGLVYHIVFFSSVNPAAYIFGAFFILQSMVFLFVGVLSSRYTFRFSLTTPSVIGAIFIAYAMLVYPIFNYIFGHAYPYMPIFGVAPCPATIFTFGILLWTKERLPIYVLIIPFLWSLIGVSAAIKLGVAEDYGLALAGILGVVLIAIGNYRKMHRAR